MILYNFLYLSHRVSKPAYVNSLALSDSDTYIISILHRLRFWVGEKVWPHV